MNRTIDVKPKLISIYHKGTKCHKCEYAYILASILHVDVARESISAKKGRTGGSRDRGWGAQT
jgi:hypothetical protein